MVVMTDGKRRHGKKRLAVWDREFRINEARQLDRMFCVTEYMLRMPHGVHAFEDAAWLVILEARHSMAYVKRVGCGGSSLVASVRHRDAAGARRASRAQRSL